MLKLIKIIGVILTLLFLLLGVTFFINAFDDKLAHPSPMLFFFASLGLFNGASVIMFLVVIIELLKPKDTNPQK